MAIYTKRGDKGETSMYDVDNSQRMRIGKDSLQVEALGAIDELNSYLGVVKGSIKESNLSLSISRAWPMSTLVRDIQKNLLTIGSITGGSKLRFSSVQTKKLERIIDKLEGSLPVLKNFVFPGGSEVAAHLQYARALARRAERRMVYFSKSEKVSPQIMEYLNRLSDALFMLAREANHRSNIKEEVWVGKKNR